MSTETEKTCPAWLVPGARAWRTRGCGSRVACVAVAESTLYDAVWVVREEEGGRVIAVPVEDLSPRPAKLAPEEMAKRAPLPPDSLVGALHDRIHPASGRLLASMPVRVSKTEPVKDACQLCGVPLADATDVEAGYVTAFARDPEDVGRCLSHGRTNLGASHG